MKVCTKCKESKEIDEFRVARGSCKDCETADQLKRNKTKDGKLKAIYVDQVKHSKTRKHEPPIYTKQEFIDRFINDEDYLLLYNNWVDSDYKKMLSPSFDRLDDYKPYSLGNLNKWMTWEENSNKGYKDRKAGKNNEGSRAVIGTNIKTGETIEFHSGCEAKRNGFQQSGIGLCCRGKQSYHKGYTWRFKE